MTRRAIVAALRLGRVADNSVGSVDVAAFFSGSPFVVDRFSNARLVVRACPLCRRRHHPRYLLNAKRQQRRGGQLKNFPLTHAYLPVENTVTALAETFRFEKAEEHAEEYDVHNNPIA